MNPLSAFALRALCYFVLKLLVSELPDSSIPKFHTLTGKALKAINLKNIIFLLGQKLPKMIQKLFFRSQQLSTIKDNSRSQI